MTALACGLLIGIERGFKLRRRREGTRVAGARTFTLLGFVSGLAGFVGSLGHQLAAGALVTAAAAVIAVGYAYRPNLSEHPDATTPVAALATLALGFVAGFGEPGLAILAQPSSPRSLPSSRKPITSSSGWTKMM